LKSLRDKAILTEQENETMAKRKADEEAMHIATPSASSAGSAAQASGRHRLRDSKENTCRTKPLLGLACGRTKCRSALRRPTPQ
jgi:hypothetical protein